MKGVYILLINVGKNLQLKIGSLGKINFDKGKYAYVGSAQNNLEKRIKRHTSKNKKKFWHIDYLLDNKFTKVLDVFYKNSGKSEECKIADRLNKTEVPIPNFGCSDCNCKSHLFKIINSDVILKLELKEL
jgi:Uri superfamily endonuclease